MTNIKDVAIKAGVSVSTVSRVMNNRGYISQATKDKVFNAMKDLNYQPNEIAKSLFKKKSFTSSVLTIKPHVLDSSKTILFSVKKYLIVSSNKSK